MPTLPWTQPKRSAPPPNEVVVMASRFQLGRRRDVLPFLLAALRIRRQMLGSPGAVGVSLIARPFAGTFYTLSAWTDREALDSAVAQQPHRDVMTRFRTRTEGSVFVFWRLGVTHLPPRWDDARSRLDEEAGRTTPRSR